MSPTKQKPRRPSTLKRPLQRGLERLEHRLCLSANWAEPIGGPGDDSPRALAGDAGFAYAAVDIQTVPDSGVKDVTLVKYDTAGNEVDRTVIAQSVVGGGQTLRVTDLAVDSNGDLIVAGYFSGSHDLDPASAGGELVGSEMPGGFVAKYAADFDFHFDFQWSETLAGEAADFLTAIDVVGSSIYLTGWTYWPGFNQVSLAFGDETVLDYSAETDYTAGFLVKVEDTQLGPDATWAQQVQDSGPVRPTEILATDTADTEEIFVAGSFGDPYESSTAVIAGQVMKTGNSSDAFLAKFIGSGPVQWAHQIAEQAVKKEKNGFSNASALARSSEGSIYVAGGFLGARDFGTGVLTPVSWEKDGYVVRIDEMNGSPQTSWAHQISSAESTAAYGVGVSGETVYVTGHFYDTTDFDLSSSAEPELTPRGMSDLFLLELDADSGSFLDVRQAGGEGSEQAIDLVIGGSDSIHVLGRSDSPLVPTMGGTVETGGGNDGVLIHVNPAAPQLTIEPAVTSIEERTPQEFSALDGDVLIPVNWDLDGGVATNSSTDTFTLPTNLPVGRHILTATLPDSSGGPLASYRHVFDVTLAAPSGLMADVVRNGKTSDIYLSWEAVPGAGGYYLEFNNRRLTSGWELRYQGAETTFLHCIDKRAGTAEYRVRAYTTLPGGEEVVSPYSTVLEVDPAVGGVVESSTSTSSEIAAAVDLALADDELLGRKYV